MWLSQRQHAAQAAQAAQQQQQNTAVAGLASNKAIGNLNRLGSPSSLTSPGIAQAAGVGAAVNTAGAGLPTPVGGNSMVANMQRNAAAAVGHLGQVSVTTQGQTNSPSQALAGAQQQAGQVQPRAALPNGAVRQLTPQQQQVGIVCRQ